MAKKIGLNRGLGALLGGNSDSDVMVKERSSSVSVKKSKLLPSKATSVIKNKVKEKNKIAKKTTIVAVQELNGFVYLSPKDLSPGKYQPRKTMQEEDLQSLSDSIKSQGILQPIIARKKSAADNSLEIIAGERRWRAAQLVGLSEVPVIIKDLTDEQAMAIGLIENIQRENLNPIEEALALHRLYSEFGLTHAEIAESVGKSRSAVSNLLRLLALDKSVQLMLERGDLEAGHAKVLLSVEKKVDQIKLAEQIVARDLSVRETEVLVNKFKEGDISHNFQPAIEEIDPDILRLQKTLSEKVGSVVKIKHKEKGTGKVIIKYNSLDELEGILMHIN